MAAATAPRTAALPLAGGRESATVRLHPLLVASAIAPPAYLHRDSDRLAALRALGVRVPRRDWVRIPVVAFLVEHPGAGLVLVDTGFHPSVAVEPRQNLGRFGAFVFKGIEMTPHDAVPAQLRARGFDPGDVRLVVMTHFHVDHASAMSEFPDATFLFTRREWEAASEPRAWLRGYRRRQFDHAFDYRWIDFERVRGSYATFGRSVDVFDDGSVRLVYTPGHTHGHQSVVLRLAGREALLAGDAIYSMRTLREGALPYLVADMHEFRRSLREIQLFAEYSPGALIVPGHDWGFWQGLEPLYV